MRRAIIIAVCSLLTLGVIASCIVIAATLSLASAPANGVPGAFDWAIPGIGAFVFAVVMVFAIPVLFVCALATGDWPTFFTLVRKVLELMGLQ